MVQGREDFFSIVGHLSSRRHKEDQLSNTFRACFNFSSAFRRCLVQMLSSICRVTRSNQINWECTTQLSKRDKSGRLRYDICLRQTDNDGDLRAVAPSFILESKVGARLTR